MPQNGYHPGLPMNSLGAYALRELAGFQASSSCAVSLYVDLDPSSVPTPVELDRQLSALLSEAVHSGRIEKDDLSHEERTDLRLDIERISRYFDEEFVRNGARGLAVFSCGPDNLWRVLELSSSVPSMFRISRSLYLEPLVPIAGGLGDVLIVVAGREQGQIWLFEDGHFDLLADHFEEQPRRHDQGGWAQARYARHSEQLVYEHLRDLAADLDRRSRRLHPLGLVLVASDETRSELERLLSFEARRMLIGFAQVESHPGPAVLKKAVQPLIERLREERETRLVARWQEEMGRGARACAGWESSLEAASDGRIEVLLYRAGVQRSAWLCSECSRVSASPGNCTLDGTTLLEHDEGLDLLIHRTLVHGGSIVVARDPSSLDVNEGVGALLRY